MLKKEDLKVLNVMTLPEISNIRMFNQQISSTKINGVKEIAGWMGAMQAQDYSMAKWAIGTRLPESSEKDIENAINKGDIIRTHLLRPTWHFVSSDDIHWMLELTAPAIKSSMKSRHKELELTEPLLKRYVDLIQKSLEGGSHLTREEMVSIMKKEKIATENNRASHILFMAELEGIICNGVIKNKKQTYALLNERVHKKKDFTKEEALEKLAKKYFLSHGPATLQDFTWWSGLPVRDARNALEMAKPHFISEKTDTNTYWLSGSFPGKLTVENHVYLLPAFDEFMISYKDRTPSLSLIHNKKAISNNGFFRPIVILNGQVAGLWKRTIKNDKALVETFFFKQVSKSVKHQIEKKANALGKFLDKETVVIHHKHDITTIPA